MTARDSDDGITDRLAAARARARAERTGDVDPRMPRWARRRRADDGDSLWLREVRRADPVAAVAAARRAWLLFADLGLLDPVTRACLTRDHQGALAECHRQHVGGRVRNAQWPPQRDDVEAVS